MIEKLFNDYKEATLKIINNLKEDIDFEYLMDERFRILNEISELGLEKEVVRKNYSEFGLDELDKVLKIKIEEEMKNVKRDIEKAKAGRAAHRGYNAAMRGNNLFTKKV